MKMRIVAALVILAVVAGCKKEERAALDTVTSSAATAAPATRSEAQRAGLAAAPPSPPSALKPDRMIVRTAQVSLVVADTAGSFDKLTTLVESLGGYVNDSKRWRDGEQQRATLVIRVPADRLTSVLAAIRKVALRVQSENVSGEDVTQEFVDLESRVRNLEAAEIEMRQLMTTVRERSKKADDILEVYAKLTELRGEIEQAKGRMRYLSQMSSYSTISVELIPDAAAKPVVEPGWQPVAVLKDASRSLVSTLQWLADVAIWLLVYVLPIAVLFGAALFAVVRVARAGRARRAGA